MATVTIPSAADSRNQQHDANTNTETAPITQEYILTQIANSVKVRSAGGSSYADFNFSIFKSGKYTDLLLYYAGLIEETNKKESVATKDEERWEGIPANNPVAGKTDNWWKLNIVNALTELGYKWTFLYYRDQELPFGFRVSWSSDTSNTETNPIWSARHKEFPYTILPENKFVLQDANKVETTETTPAGQEENSNTLKNICSIATNKIANAAQLGKNYVFIPWSEFGSLFRAQLAFIQLTDPDTVPDSSTQSTLTVAQTYKLFKYQFKNNTYGSSTSYKIYEIKELKESKSGVKPIAFFSSNDFNGEYIEYEPNTDTSNSLAGPDFTLKQMFTAGAHYGFDLYADVDSSGETYCGGIVLSWSDGNATTKAQEYYVAQRNAYNNSLNITYAFTDIPVYSEYENTQKQINSTYLSKFIELTSSKMRGAFDTSTRRIVILWTDIDSKNASTVNKKWREEALEFNGTFTTNLHTTGMTQTPGQGLKSAYETLMLTKYFDNLQANGKVNFTWAYIAYKDVTMKESSNAIARPSDLEQACGIVVYMLNKEQGLTSNDISTAKEQLKKEIDAFGKKEDPAAKKK